MDKSKLYVKIEVLGGVRPLKEKKVHILLYCLKFVCLSGGRNCSVGTPFKLPKLSITKLTVDWLTARGSPNSIHYSGLP